MRRGDTVSLRLDRAGSLFVVGPLYRVFSGRRGKIPILMYHSVADEDESAWGPYFRIALSPAHFLQQMTWLHGQGYKTVSLAAAAEQLRTGDGARTVVITFDDGYRNFHEHAWPALDRFGFTATMFLPTAAIGDQPQIFNKRECMTWSEVRELQQHGISFGSHTVTHPQLHGLEPGRIREELLRSRQTIEDKTGCPVDTFAYPYAFPQTDEPFIATLRGILQESGYRHGVCTRIGRAGAASDPLFLERVPVNSADDEALLKAKLEGSYDWVGGLQSVAKRVRKSRTKA